MNFIRKLYNKRQSKLFIAMLCWFNCYAFFVSGHDFTKINNNYRYNPNAGIKFDHVLTVHDSVATIFLKIEFRSGDSLNDYVITYGFQEDYSDNSMSYIDSLQSQQHLILQDENIYYLKFETRKRENLPLLVVQIKDKTGVSFFFDIPLETAYGYTSLLLMEKSRDIPLFRNYVHENDTFRIVSLNNEAPKVFLYQYQQEFKPAAPPMSEDGNVDKTLIIDSLFSLPTGKRVSIKTEGMYFVQTDTSTLQGISFRVTSRYFPKYATAEKLTAPLIYISTISEREKIERSSDKKAALDQFWLDVSRSRARAKNIIDQFYDQTALVNKLFTTYKPGWKTDRGMIYMLYGVPDEVYISEGREEWIYHKNDNFSKIRFTFVKLKNIFTKQHYELLRDNNYDKHWFRTIDLWRTGRKEI